MLKQEKSRAAAAEASLHGASVTSNSHQQTVNTTVERKVEHKPTSSLNASHRDCHLQNYSSSSDQLPEQQKSHRPSHKGLLL